MVAVKALVAVLLLGAALALADAAALERTTKLPHILSRVGFQNHLRNLRHLHVEVPDAGKASSTVKEMKFDQYLDHFNPVDNRTWQQRYFTRTDSYKEGGPVLIYIGGEGKETATTLMPRAMYISYLAEEFGAKLFDLEHRYYGKSQPVSDWSSENLQYLSADQALADLAYFIEYLIERGDIAKDQKVAVFGGSYPGNLAAWARIKYPHLIHAAVSSSAPVHAKADFGEYMEVVSRALEKKAGAWCTKNLKRGLDRIVKQLKSTDGLAKVKKTFLVGSQLKDKLDIDLFFEVLSNPFAGAAQYNRDYSPETAYNIQYICSKIEGDNLTDDEIVKKLAKLVVGDEVDNPARLYDWSYKSTIDTYKSTKISSVNSERQWIYQTCTEFGYFQTFSGENIPFPKEYNDVTFSRQMCKDIFGEKYDEALNNKAVARTNLEFGDRTPDVTNVIFVNGDIDPWHALGIVKDVSVDAQAVFVDGGSHCSDMYYPSSHRDSKSLQEAHDKIHKLIKKALYEIPAEPTDPETSTTVAPETTTNVAPEPAATVIPGCSFAPRCPAKGKVNLAIPCPNSCKQYIACDNGSYSVKKCSWYHPHFDSKSGECALFNYVCAA